MKKILCIAGLVLIIAACGRKGPLIPPEAMVAAPIGDLRVEQQGERFLVSWSLPTRQQAGGPLKDLAGFLLFRREVLPPGEDCEECVAAYRLVATAELDYLKEVVRSGNSFVFVDREPVTGKTYQYKVISYKTDGAESKESNLARRKKVPPPISPPVKAVASATEISLSWEPAVAPPNGTIIGYLILRKKEGGALLPITGKPLPQTTYDDLGLDRGTTYAYAIRTVARVEGETVTSELSAEVAGKLSEEE